MTANTPSPSTSALELLWNRLQAQGEFPALARSVDLVTQFTHSDQARIDALADVVLRDVALATKVLRLANSAAYRRSGMAEVSTVSRALLLLGFETVRNLALASAVIARLGETDPALVKELARALVGALFAEAIAPHFRVKRETAFLGTLLRHLGTLLVRHYFPDEAAQIDAWVAAGKPAAKAEQEVLGVSAAAFGLFVAKMWGLPSSVQSAMEPLTGRPPAHWDGNSPEALRWLCGAAQSAAQVAGEEGKSLAAIKSDVTAAFPFLKGIDPPTWQSVTEATEEAAVAWWRVLVGQGSPFVALGNAPLPQRATEEKRSSGSVAGATPAPAALSSEAAPLPQNPHAPVHAEEAARRLILGLEDLAQTLLEGQPRAALLYLACELVWQALACERVLLLRCYPSALLPEVGIAPEWSELQETGAIPLAEGKSVLHLAVAQGVDIEIDDRADPKIAAKFPPPFNRFPRGRSVLLLPLRVKGANVGLIYLDKPQPQQLKLPKTLKQLVRLWRNQVALAWGFSASASG